MSAQTLELRKSIRSQRRKLSIFQQRKNEISTLKHLRAFITQKKHHKIGLYLDAFGEIYTHDILLYCFTHHKKVYLPMICPMNQTLVWVHITKNQYLNQRFSRHHLGMLEPMASRGMHVSHLDLLIMPLLACDAQGTRMGMGGGFYDRTLARAPYKPFRIGLGHNFQYLNTHLQRQSWDQPLDLFISPRKIYSFKRHNGQ